MLWFITSWILACHVDLMAVYKDMEHPFRRDREIILKVYQHWCNGLMKDVQDRSFVSLELEESKATEAADSFVPHSLNSKDPSQTHLLRILASCNSHVQTRILKLTTRGLDHLQVSDLNCDSAVVWANTVAQIKNTLNIGCLQIHGRWLEVNTIQQHLQWYMGLGGFTARKRQIKRRHRLKHAESYSS